MAAKLKYLAYPCTVLYGGYTFFGETDAYIRDGFRDVRVPIYKQPPEIRKVILQMFSNGGAEYMYIRCNAEDVIVGDVRYA